MAFIFKARPKSPHDLVRATKEAILKFETAGGDKKKANEEISKNLIAMKAILYGDGGFMNIFFDVADSDPVPEFVAQLAQEVYSSDLLPLLAQNIQKFEFEARKDVAQIFNNLLRRQIGTRFPTSEYVSTRESILTTLMKG
ncbi:hypothetical protein HK096_007800, partial [Nowakowskiella sp. JEL0078]